jgi:hypothetical protein
MDSPAISTRSTTLARTEQSILDSIRNRIEAGIRPWRFSNDRPPFTPRELLVMALVTADKRLEVHEVLNWVMMTFQFYSISASKYICRIHSQDLELRPALDGGHILEQLMPGLALEVTQFELPLETCAAFPGKGFACTISVANAENFLPIGMRRDSNIESKPFRLFDLSPELRNAIYEMVFAYPKAGLVVRPGKAMPFSLRTRSYQ